MREQVEIEIAGEEQHLRLYATSLKANPWAAGVVRALGGKAPEPRDLSPARGLTQQLAPCAALASATFALALRAIFLACLSLWSLAWR